MEDRYQFIVIGAGPGGYEAAIRAARLGLKTAVIEERELGGTCLNRGCIPTKALLHSSNLYYETKKFSEAGINTSEITYDLVKIYEQKDQVVLKIQKGIESLLKANKIDVIAGRGRILKAGSVSVTCGDNELILQTDTILVATGSKPYLPELQGSNLKGVMSSDELLSGVKDFNRLVIIGGGVIGCEFATIFSQLGKEVVIIEAADRILPSLDKELSQSAAMNLKKKGVIIQAKSMVTEIEEAVKEEGTGGLQVSFGVNKILTDGVLICIGRAANTENLFSREISPKMEKGRLLTDERYMTSIPGIYAIGDVIGGFQLAHSASAQGIAVAELIGAGKVPTPLKAVPSCVYMNPEIAAVGLSEEEAKRSGYDVIAGKYPMSGNCKAVLSMDERSYVKIVAEKVSHKILGAQIICARATDMIGEFSLAISSGLTVEEMHEAIRPHPTYEEAITEALAELLGGAIHLMPGK